MTKLHIPSVRQHTGHMNGFSLIELSIVLVILSLLSSVFLPNLQQQRQHNAFIKTQQSLEIARDALMTYALLNGYLPCPDWATLPADPAYGLASDSCISPNAEGWLPFRSLGLTEGDGWFGIAAGPHAGRITYRVDPAFTRSFGQRIALSTVFASNLSIVDQAGNKLTSDAERPIAVLISSGADGQLNGENGIFRQDGQNPRYESHPATSGFDDQLLWLGRPSLFSVLIRGGATL